jgi:hypothetical protein
VVVDVAVVVEVVVDLQGKILLHFEE